MLKSCQFQRVETQADFLQALTDFQPDLILSNDFLLSFNEMQVLEQTAIHAPLIPVIMRIESPNKDKAVEYLKAELSNCIPKGKFK